MNPSRLFILRPVATLLLMAAIVLSGALAYRLLPLAALPQVDYPTIQVSTLYPGASPEVMAAAVTAPLERQFGAMAGLTQMSSTSSAGSANITLQFSLGESLDVAEQSVQAAINAAANFLPDDLPTPPTYSKVNPADAPVLTLAMTSDTLPLTTLQDLVDTRVAQRIAQVSGVGLVSLGGGQRPAVRVRANASALAGMGIGLEQVRAAIAASNSNQAKGNLEGPLEASTLDANTQLRQASDYRELIITTRHGNPVRLSDVAQVDEGVENPALAAWANQRPAILVNVQRQPGANVIEVVDAITDLLPELRASLPSAVQIEVLTDRTLTIRSSVRDTQFELVLAVALVVMVIFLFLRSASATLIPSLAVPLSLIGTFGVMYLAGFSLNNLTLMALTIATGFVVDDAIVMIENISRHVEEGASPLEAALDGSKQIGFTIISLTFSLIAVLIPLLFMGDVVGRLFREFAITLAIAILISAAVSLSLTPMLCARLLKPHVRSATPRHTWFDRFAARYGQALDWALDHARIVLSVAVATLVLTLLLAWWVPKGFFPSQDTGVLQAVTEGPQSTSFKAMVERQQTLANAVLSDPAVQSLTSIVGIDGVNTTLHSGRLLINLQPHGSADATNADGTAATRSEPAGAVIERLKESTRDVAGLRVYFQPVQDLTVDDRVTRTQYQWIAESPDTEALERWAPQMVERLSALPELADVTSNLSSEGLKASIEIDRDAAGRLGVTVSAINEALYSAFGQRFASTIYTQNNQYRVVLEVASEGRPGLASIDALYVTAGDGRQIPLTSVARIGEGPVALAVHREKQFPAVTFSFNLAPGVALGDAVAAIERESARTATPVSINTRFQGATLAFRAALGNQLFLILAAVVTMYIVLGVLYESFVHPLTILSTLPSAAVGALLALFVTRTDLSVIAVIGIVLLIGITQKNAIMIIDFALDARRHGGLGAREAIRQASLQRVRPILMTTLAALLSAVPLVLGSGPGSELRGPLGIVLIGGLLMSQALTLFTTPVVYLAFEALSQRFTRRREPQAAVTEGELGSPLSRQES